MKRREEVAMDGTTILFLTPENDEDIRELERLEKEKKLDPHDSFSSDPSVWTEEPKKTGASQLGKIA